MSSPFASRLSLLALIACFVVPAAHALMEYKVEKKFTVPSGKAALAVNLFHGAINVTESDGDTIEIVVTELCEGDNDEEAAPRRAALDLGFEQAADGRVSLTATYQKKVSFTWKNWPPVLITATIKVPRTCDLVLRTDSGDITVGQVRGTLKLTNDSGKIFADEIDGTVTARSRLGDIGVTACTGMIDAQTVTGRVEIGRAAGGARLASDGGTIEVQAASGDFKVNGNSSEVKVRFAFPVTHAAEVYTSGANITAIFDQRSATEITAHSSVFAKVTARGLAAAGVPDGDKGSALTAKLNHGGAAVALRANGGRVLLIGQEPPLEIPVMAATAQENTESPK